MYRRVFAARRCKKETRCLSPNKAIYIIKIRRIIMKVKRKYQSPKIIFKDEGVDDIMTESSPPITAESDFSTDNNYDDWY